MTWQNYIPESIKTLYEIVDYHHAAAILANEFPEEFKDICTSLSEFSFTLDDLKAPGGSESAIPKKFSNILRPRGWREDQLTSKHLVDEKVISHDSHKVDYLKGRVALDLEWNSKDQTYDRDLYAFRAFFDYNKISVGVLITRSNQLDPLFRRETYINSYGKEAPLIRKYGASTTHMGKLIPRLEAGRNGGCPVLVFGITPNLMV